jgi:hypothetical protein
MELDLENLSAEFDDVDGASVTMRVIEGDIARGAHCAEDDFTMYLTGDYFAGNNIIDLKFQSYGAPIHSGIELPRCKLRQVITQLTAMADYFDAIAPGEIQKAIERFERG